MATTHTTIDPDPHSSATATGEEAWRAVADRLLARLGSLTWWEAVRWAAGHEHERPRLASMALRAYATQAAFSAEKQRYLERGHQRLHRVGRRCLWSDPRTAPPPGIDPESIEEVAEASLAVACDALTAVVLADELGRGVLPDHRRTQLLRAIHRSGLLASSGH